VGGEFAKIIEEHTKPFEEVLWAADHSWLDDIAYRMKSDLAQVWS